MLSRVELERLMINALPNKIPVSKRLTVAQPLDPCHRRNSLPLAGNRLWRWLISSAGVSTVAPAHQPVCSRHWLKPCGILAVTQTRSMRQKVSRVKHAIRSPYSSTVGRAARRETRLRAEECSKCVGPTAEVLLVAWQVVSGTRRRGVGELTKKLRT